MNMDQAIDYLNQQKLNRFPTLESWADAFSTNEAERQSIIDCYTAFSNGELLWQKQKWYLDWKKRKQHG